MISNIHIMLLKGGIVITYSVIKCYVILCLKSNEHQTWFKSMWCCYIWMNSAMKSMRCHQLSLSSHMTSLNILRCIEKQCPVVVFAWKILCQQLLICNKEVCLLVLEVRSSTYQDCQAIPKSWPLSHCWWLSIIKVLFEQKNYYAKQFHERDQ